MEMLMQIDFAILVLLNVGVLVFLVGYGIAAITSVVRQAKGE